MWLVPERSPQYQTAKEVTTRVNSNVEWKDVKAGNRVTFKNGLVATYLGEWYVVEAGYNNIASECFRDIHLSPKRKKIFRIEADWEHKKSGTLYENNAPKISSIDDPTTIILDECQKMVLEASQKSTRNPIIYVSQNKIDVEHSITVRRVQLTHTEVDEIFFREVTFWEHSDGSVAYSQTYGFKNRGIIRGFDIDWQYFTSKKVLKNPSTNFRTIYNDGVAIKVFSEIGKGLELADLSFFKVEFDIDDNGRIVTVPFPY
jgi:hypothetical protein